MFFVFLTIGWILGAIVSAIFVVQPLIILFFALPTSINMMRQGVLLNTGRIVLNNLISLFVLLALFAGSVFVIDNYFPKLVVGFWIGATLVFLLGLPKLGKKHNMTEFIENNMKNMDISFLSNYLQSIIFNHPDSQGKSEHVSKLSLYIKSVVEDVQENSEQIISDSLQEIVGIIMTLYRETFEEHWPETMIELSSTWDFENVKEPVVKKEIFIALITLDFTFCFSDTAIYNENAQIIRRHVIDYLIEMYGNKEHIETLVDDIYTPAATHASEVHIDADTIFNSVICNRLKQPTSAEVILTISRLYGHMMGKWSHLKIALYKAEQNKDIETA